MSLQAAVAARFAAWAPLPEEEFARFTPRYLAAQEEEEWQRQHAIACQPCHYTLPVPTDQGQKRVAVHGIMRDTRPQKLAQNKQQVSIPAFTSAAFWVCSNHGVCLSSDM